MFDHEKLDVYRLSLDYVSMAYEAVSSLSGALRSTRDQLVRSSQSVPLNIAEGNAKRTGADRARFFDIARGSAMECAATVDVLRTLDAITVDAATEHKALLHRIVSMLVRLSKPSAGVAREDGEQYGAGVGESDYDYENDYDYDYEPASSGIIENRGGGVALERDGGAG